VFIERIEERSVTVVPVITGEPPVGYFFEDVVIDPEQVRVTGPESLIETLESVYTKDINIKNLTETTVKEVGLDLPDEKISVDESMVVSVKIIIKEQFVLKRLEKKEIVPQNLSEGYDAFVEDTPISVLFKVPKRLEREITAESIVIYVDCEDIENTGTFTLPLKIDSSREDITLLKAEPGSVTIEVTEKTERAGGSPSRS
jgi:YbbR domain-containing protein